MTTTETLKFEAFDRGEEAARADLYGLLAALFFAPPSQTLLDTIGAQRASGEGVLERAWVTLAETAARAHAETVRDEYEALFIGIGKPEVMLYGSYYLSGFLMEKPLAALRTDLAGLGLERADALMESEDHIAALCEVMRHLIASDDVMQDNIALQKKFYAAHMQTWVGALCAAVLAHPGARFYAAVAHFAVVFFEVENQAFDMA